MAHSAIPRDPHPEQREDQIHVVGVVLSLCKAYLQAARRAIDDPRRMRILRAGLTDLEQSLTRLRLALEAEERASQMPPASEPIPDTVTPPSDLPTSVAEDLARYAHALVYRDIATVGDVLDKVSRDPALEQVILDWHRLEEVNVQRRDDDTYAGIGDASGGSPQRRRTHESRKDRPVL